MANINVQPFNNHFIGYTADWTSWVKHLPAEFTLEDVAGHVTDTHLAIVGNMKEDFKRRLQHFGNHFSSIDPLKHDRSEHLSAALGVLDKTTPTDRLLRNAFDLICPYYFCDPAKPAVIIEMRMSAFDAFYIKPSTSSGTCAFEGLESGLGHSLSGQFELIANFRYQSDKLVAASIMVTFAKYA